VQDVGHTLRTIGAEGFDPAASVDPGEDCDTRRDQLVKAVGLIV